MQKLGTMNQSKDENDDSSLRALLTAAGYRQGIAVVTFRGCQLFLGLLLLGMMAVIPKQLLGFPSTLGLLTVYVGAGCLGYYSPRVWLQGVVARRQAEIGRGLPDVLDLLVICVEAGLGLDMAIDRVTTSIKSVHKALGEELQLLTLELRAGVARVTALRNLAKRTSVLELRSLVAVLVQTERFGTSIAQALRVQSDVMRTERQLKAEESAAKLPVKLMIPLIFFIFPVVFIIVLGPALLGVARTLLPALAQH
jgi:tight adherence protein C